MKKIMFTSLAILLTISAASFADYSIPVSHAHDGRQHSHQLPVQGIAHRHGIGSLGEPVVKTQRQPTGTVIYGDPQPPVVRQPSGTVIYGNQQPAVVKPPRTYYPSTTTRPVTTPAPVVDTSSHAHDGRQHSHPLPAQGVSHRHGAGSIGERVVSVSKQPSGTVIYGTPQPQVKTPEPYYQPNSTNQPRTTNRRNPIDFNIFRSGNNPRSRPQDNRRKRRNLTKGDTSCRAGSADCNVCAANVQQQFQRAAQQQISWGGRGWNFAWPKRYPPENLTPMRIFNGDPVHALGIPDKHVQGFVRTNSTRFPYAGSHSHKKRGGVFVIKRDGDGSLSLATLHHTKGKHPSGVHVIGKYLTYGLGSRLYFKDLNSPNQRYDISLTVPAPKANFGGGLGVLKLSADRHLIVATGPGGQKAGPRFNRFYMLKSINGRPTSIRLINESSTKNPSQWPAGLAFSENLSLITECGTGDIYAVHTTGDEKGMSAITGNGYWRLSKLVAREGALGLTAINAFTKRQNMKSCNIRAAATVHVNPQHKLEFYCHAYAKDPDGTTFNVLGRARRDKDRFKFKVGVVQ